MNIEVISAEYLDGYRISLVFGNGKKGVVDLSHYANRGGVFGHFKEPDYFRRFSINPDFGVLCWQGGADIAPETLYALATGEPLPDWMDSEDATVEDPSQ